MGNDTLQQGIQVAGPVVPNNPADTYPTHDCRLGKGGFRIMGTVPDRDAIPISRLRHGMRVKCLDDGLVYELKTSYDFLAAPVANNWTIVETGTSLQETFYVDPATGDDNNNGTQAAPFQTISKAFTEAIVSLALLNEVNINLAEGVYGLVQGLANVTTNVSGIINVTGNTAIPASVICTGPGLGIGNYWTLNAPNLEINVNGFVMREATILIRNIASRLKVHFMDFSEFAVPIQNESPYASTYFVQNAFGNSQINGPLEPNAGTYVFRNLNGGLLDIDQDLATINTNYGIQTQGRLFTRISRFLDFHLLPFAVAYGLKIETGTYCNLQSRFDVDGTAAQELLANANLAIINHGIIEMPFSVNMNFNNWIFFCEVFTN